MPLATAIAPSANGLRSFGTLRAACTAGSVVSQTICPAVLGGADAADWGVGAVLPVVGLFGFCGAVAQPTNVAAARNKGSRRFILHTFVFMFFLAQPYNKIVALSMFMTILFAAVGH